MLRCPDLFGVVQQEGYDVRITKGRELDSIIAQLLGWERCGCGDESCELFREPTTGDYRPLPDYQQLDATLARYQQALERILYEYPGEPLEVRAIACDALKNKL